MTYVIKEDGEELLETLELPLDLTDKGDGKRAGIKLPENALGVEENVVTLQVLGTHEFDITLRLNLIKVPKGTEIDYNTYVWRDPTWNIASALDSIILYMHNEMADEITDRVEANIDPRLKDLRDDVDNLIEDMHTKADRSEIIGENLIPTPYFRPSGYTTGGVVYNYDDNYVFTVNSESSASANGYCSLVDHTIGIPNLVNGETYTYYATNGSDNSEVKIRCYYYNTSTKTERAIDNAFVNNPLTFTYSPNENEVLGLQLYTLKGANPTNEVITVMLEKGEKPHSYQLYNLSRQKLREDIEAVKKSIPRTTLERVQNTTRVITVPESSTFASVSKIEGKTVKTKNLIPFPYYSDSDTEPVNGIKRVINDDGTITFSGTSTSNTTNFFCAYSMSLKAGTYTLSGCPDVNGLQIRMKVGSTTYDINANETKTITLDSDATGIQIYPRVTKADVVCNNAVFKPMLEEGEVATEYEPYFEGLHSAPVESINAKGKNLLNPEKIVNRYLVGNTTNGFALNNTGTGLSYVVKLKPNTPYVFSKTKAVGDKFRLVLTEEEIKIGTSIPGIQPVLYSDTDIHTKQFTTDDKNVYCTVTLNNTAPLPSGSCGEMLIEGSEIVDYVPYSKKEISITDIVKSLPDYGCSAGNVSNVLDLENMKYYHNVGSVDMSNLNWNRYAENRFNVSDFITPYNVKKPATNNDVPNAICAVYPVSSANYWTANNLLGICIGNNFNCYDDTVSDDADALKSKLSGVILNYELATPEVIDLKTIIPPIAVTPNGTLTFNNEHNLDIPTEVIYKKEG